MTKHRVECGIAILFLVVCFAMLCLTPVMTPDLFWQLRAGHDITLTHQAPAIDRFSWTRAGAPWIAPEWLIYRFAWHLYLVGDLGAVWICYALCIIALGILLWIITLPVVRSPWLAFLWVLAAGMSFRVWLAPRPFLLSYLLFPIFLWIVQRVRRDPSRARLLWTLLPLAVVWANLHQAVLAGIAVIVFYGIGDVISAIMSADPTVKRQRWQQGGRLLAVSALCLLATLINPYGMGFLIDTLATLRDPAALNHVKEWLPLYRLPQSDLIPFYAYLALLACLLIVARKKPGRLDLLLLAILLFETILHVRHSALFELAAVVLLPETLVSAVDRIVGTPARREDLERLRRLAIPALTVLAVAVIVRSSAPNIRQISNERGPVLGRLGRVAFEYDAMPERACRFLEAEQIPTTLRLFNSYTIGGFLSLKAPDYPVFIDGRANLYFGPVMDAYSRGMKSPSAFYALLDHFGVDLAIVSQKNEQQALLINPDWALVCQDYILVGEQPYVRALVFLRKRPELAALIAKCQRDKP